MSESETCTPTSVHVKCKLIFPSEDNKRVDLEQLHERIPVSSSLRNEGICKVKFYPSPTAVVNVTTTGRITCMGVLFDTARARIRNVARFIQKTQIPDLRLGELKITNWNATKDLGFKVNIIKLAYSGEGAFYEPEIDLACVRFTDTRNNCTVNVFSSGKMTITAALEESIQPVAQKFARMAELARVGSSHPHLRKTPSPRNAD
eukprot:TRINITY_DN30184_c0_g1_i3.p1 TRINITY_DN30184_c0_g1~~TRINITY_DN30184_c0_g1_i3.p1  ORF type:complete len:217 (-),score=41.71 TRINITY_DN30184_c0_g1_i3:207-818(-)